MEDPRRVEEGLGHIPLEDYDHEKKKELAKIDDEADRIDDDDTEKEGRSRAEQDDQQVKEKDKEAQPLIKEKSKRVATLDAFRGLTIVVNN